MTSSLPGIGRRLAAMLYESLVIFALLLVFFLFPQIVLSGFSISLDGRLLWIHLFLVPMVYFVWCWLHGGQTLPMKTWRLCVEDRSGMPPRPLQAVLRFMAAWPSLLLFGIGILWAIFDPDRQFLHDRIAGTRIGWKLAENSAALDPPEHASGS